MKTSQYLLSTTRNTPNNTEAKSHQLMLKAGMISQLSSGLFTWLPTGLRVLKKAKNLIRKEMNKIGALEIAMPLVQPAILWKNSGRWSKYGTELLRFKNRHNTSFVLGPTHEEVISNLMYSQISSYKDFPLNVYQITTKFRDEMRPRYGIIRSREFIMKDGYSFHKNEESLQNTYEIMYKTYNTIFTKIGLKFFIIQGDNENIGGNVSHEFHAIIKSNEKLSKKNKIVNNDYDKFQKIKKLTNIITKKNPMENLKLISVPNSNNIDYLTKTLNISKKQIIKTFIVHTKKNIHSPLLALMIRSDHELDIKKVENLPQVAIPLSFANEKEIYSATGVQSQFLGPINLSLPFIIDHNVSIMNNFIAGANKINKYFCGINWNRDLPIIPKVEDLNLNINKNKFDHHQRFESILNKNTIELAHIFQLGNQYSNIIKIKDKDNHQLTVIMGCYGIGIARMIAASIEQNHDEHGIIWSQLLTPFDVAILPINLYKSSKVQQVSEKIYNQLCLLNIDVLLDDREEHLGKMFADIELIGIPHIIIISDRSLRTKETEYKNRKSGKYKKINTHSIVNFLIHQIMKQ